MPGRFREVPLIQSTWFMRARSFIGFIEHKAEDLDYCLRHAELGGIFAKVEGDALVTYRHCAGSLRHAIWAECERACACHIAAVLFKKKTPSDRIMSPMGSARCSSCTPASLIWDMRVAAIQRQLLNCKRIISDRRLVASCHYNH